MRHALIFDLDGTLIDSALSITWAFNQTLSDFGKAPVPLSQVKLWIGEGSTALLAKVFDATTLGDAHARFLLHYEQSPMAQPYAEVCTGLKRLSAHYTLALCTNKPARFLPKIMHTHGFEFACMVGGDTLAHKKPHPAPLLHIADTLALPANACTMIGDSVYDVQAGKNANMRTLALNYGYHQNKPLLADKVFNDFGSLCDYLIHS